MRSLYKKHIMIVFFVLLTLVLVLGFQNCGKTMQSVKVGRELSSGGEDNGGVVPLKPLGAFVVGFGSTTGDEYYNLNKLYKHNVEGSGLITKVTTSGFAIAGYIPVDDIGSANEGPADQIQDIITLETKINSSTARKAVRLVAYSGADLEIIRTVSLPSVPSSGSFPFHIYAVEDRDNDQKKDILMFANRSTFGTTALEPASSTRSRFKILSSITFSTVQNEVELTADLTNTSISFGYDTEVNVSGDSQKEYIFKYSYNNYSVTPTVSTFKYWVYSKTGTQVEKDVSSLPPIYYGNLLDLNNDGISEIVHSTDAVNVIGTTVDVYSFQSLGSVLKLEVEGVTGRFGGAAPVSFISFDDQPEKELIFIREYMISSTEEEKNATIVTTSGNVLEDDVRSQVISNVSDVIADFQLLKDYDGDGTEDFYIVVKDGTCFGLPKKELVVVSGKTFERLHVVSLRIDQASCNYYSGYPEKTILLEDLAVREEFLSGDDSP